MKRILTISNPKELPTVIDIIHDCRFDKGRITFTQESSNLEIIFHREILEKKKVVSKFLFLKKIAVPVLECRMQLHHVDSYQILEGTQAGPGSEDFFNVMTYDEQKKQLWISTVIAKGIVVNVRKLELSIEETDNVIEEKTRMVIFS